jgi:hypothetical protein
MQFTDVGSQRASREYSTQYPGATTGHRKFVELQMNGGFCERDDGFGQNLQK